VTSGAKHIAPQAIERQLDVKEGVAHAMIHGDRRPHAVALIALDETAMLRVSEREGLGCSGYQDLAGHPRVRQLVQSYIDEVDSGLAPWQQVQAFDFAPGPFSQATGELTPTHELRRKAVRRKYADLLDRMYDEPGGES
jgi:long-chain acyl-CoA synthetase